MRPVHARGLGYAIPTLSLILWNHLAREWSAGEAVDGAVSGLTFVLAFALGSAASERWLPRATKPGTWSMALEGMAVAVLAWALVWGLWQTPLLAGLRESRGLGYAANLAFQAFAGLWRLPSARRTAVAG